MHIPQQSQSHYLHATDYLIWGIMIIARIGVIATLIRLRLQRQFPIFFGSLLAMTMRSGCLIAIAFWGSFKSYFYFYWESLALLYVINILVCWEVGRDVLKPLWLLPKWLGLAFAGTAVVATVIAYSLMPATATKYNIMLLFRQTEWALTFAECVVFLLLAIVRVMFALSYKENSMAIAAGMVMSAMLDLLAQTPRLLPQFFHSHTVDLIRSATGLIACFWWIASFWACTPFEKSRTHHELTGASN
jgi:hypothetical protein